MYYRLTSANNEKPLADFYDGECFLLYSEDNGLELHMAVNVYDERPKGNMRPVVNIEEGTIRVLPDDMRFVPITAEVKNLGEW